MRKTVLFFVVLFAAGWASGQTYNLFNSPHQQWLDNNGKPLAGGKLYSYAAGTTTPVVTYQDNAGATPNTNPIVLDSAGFATVYLLASQSYKFRMTNAQGVQQWTVDNIAGSQGTISTVPLNSILPATGTNVIANGDNPQHWQWQLTGSTRTIGLQLGETAASTNTASDSAILESYTSPNSTVWPLRVFSEIGGPTQGGFGVTPVGGDVVTFFNSRFIGPLVGDVTGDLTGNASSASAVPLDGIEDATGSNVIGNGNYDQAWEWQLTGTTPNAAFSITESSPSTNTGTDSALLKASTLAGSTIWPFEAENVNNGFGVTPTGDIQALGTGRFLGPLVGNVTGSLNGNATTATSATTAAALAGTPTQCPGSEFSTGIQANGNANCGTPAGGTSGITSINGNTAAAQTIAATAPITVSSVAGTTTLACPTCATSTGGSTALSALTAATAPNTLSNGAFTQTWNWGLTGASNGLVIGEASAGAGTGSLVEINGLSNAVTPLDVRGANLSAIHFGTGPLVGGWLSSPSIGSNLAQISGGSEFLNGSWIARAVNTANIGVNDPTFLGGVVFFGNTGLTPGNTFTPATMGTIAPAGLANIASINTPGNATTGSLNVTTNSTVSGTETVGRLLVNGGVSEGSGIKTLRGASCATPAAANAACSGTLNWPTAFPDPSYTVTCQSIGGAGPTAVFLSGANAGNVSYTLYNVAGNAAASTSTIECIAMHD